MAKLLTYLTCHTLMRSKRNTMTNKRNVIMKLSNLPYISFNQLTALSTAVSNTHVQGLKANTKKLLQAFAQNEEVQPDALKSAIQKIHDAAYTFNRKEAEFIRFIDGTTSLCKIDIDIQARGFSQRTIGIYNSVFDFDKKCMQNTCIPNASFNLGDTDIDINDRMHNLQWATNAAFELCHYFNSNVESITPDDLKAQGFTLIIKDENIHRGILEFSQHLDYEDIRVSLEYIGEGFNGDYDPENETDKPLLRFYIDQKVDGEFEGLEDASYCTNISVDIDIKDAKKVLLYIAKTVYPHIQKGYWKKVCEKLSWISIEEVNQ
jgi:hypothetical protein